MSRFGTVKVQGSSMSPTLNDGDWLLVRWIDSFAKTTATNRLLGKVVVIERENRPGIFLIKRLQKINGERFWVEGDNAESDDSRGWGWIPSNEIVGVVIVRYKKNVAN